MGKNKKQNSAELLDCIKISDGVYSIRASLRGKTFTDRISAGGAERIIRNSQVEEIVELYKEVLLKIQGDQNDSNHQEE